MAISRLSVPQRLATRSCRSGLSALIAVYSFPSVRRSFVTGMGGEPSFMGPP